MFMGLGSGCQKKSRDWTVLVDRVGEISHTQFVGCFGLVRWWCWRTEEEEGLIDSSGESEEEKRTAVLKESEK